MPGLRKVRRAILLQGTSSQPAARCAEPAGCKVRDGAGLNYVEHPFFVSRAEARERLAAVHADKLDGELCPDLASVLVRERQLSGGRNASGPSQDCVCRQQSAVGTTRAEGFLRSLSHLRRQRARGPHVVGHYLASRGLEHQVLAQVRHDLVPEQH